MRAVNFASPDSPDPLWERISLRRDNAKGQQYYFSAEEGDEDEELGEGRVINYAEIWGEAFHLRAGGTFRPKLRGAEGEDGSNDGSMKAGGPFGLGSFLSALTKRKSGSSAKLRTCPDDFDVTVTWGSIHLPLGVKIDLPIRGPGFLRVLYADPRLRIFISPADTKDKGAVKGDWEREGLVVVQVRGDLIGGAGTRTINLRDN